MHRFTQAALALAVVASLAGAPAAANQRVFVASFGSDANAPSNCTLTAPCRTFTAAMTAVDPGGEVVALDAAGYGAVAINKSVTLTANPGFYAGISAPTGNAVTINGTGIIVTLRGLNLNGVGAQNGIFMGSGARLSVENCLISNFATTGINVSTSAVVRVTDTTIRDNTVNGLFVQSGSSTSVTRGLISGNGNIGVFAYATVAGTNTVIDVADTTIDGNGKGFLAFVDGVAAEMYASVRDSRLVQNATNGVGSNGGTSGSVYFAVTNNVITNNDDGIVVFNPGGRVWATGNTISHNNTGINNASGVVESAGDNAIRNNGVNTSGSVTIIAKQ